MNRRRRTRAAWILATWIAAGIAGTAVAAGDSYDYDTAGRLTRVTYATGRVVDYAYDDAGNITAVVSSTAVAVEPSTEGPAFVNALRSSGPNPASGETNLGFSLARQGRTTLRFYDVSGRLVLTAFDRDYGPGEFHVRVRLRSLAGGVYFYRLEAPGFAATRRLVLVK